jgi:hypothetical protein
MFSYCRGSGTAIRTFVSGIFPSHDIRQSRSWKLSETPASERSRLAGEVVVVVKMPSPADVASKQPLNDGILNLGKL